MTLSTTRSFERAAKAAVAACFVVSLAGCSGSGPGLTTSSLFGGSAPAADPAAAQATPAAAPAPPPASPTQRAFHVGSVSARALRCGYNFDPAKVKTTYFASEQAGGVAPDQIANLDKAYTIAFNGVNKAAAEDPNYCSAKKTQTIKSDLGKLLAGDFTPPPPKQEVAAKGDDGFFGGLFNGSSSESGPSYGSSDWWDKQASQAGR